MKEALVVKSISKKFVLSKKMERLQGHTRNHKDLAS